MGIIDIAVSGVIGYVVNRIISTGSPGWLVNLVFTANTLAAGVAAVLRRVWLLAPIGSVFASPPGSSVRYPDCADAG